MDSSSATLFGCAFVAFMLLAIGAIVYYVVTRARAEADAKSKEEVRQVAVTPDLIEGFPERFKAATTAAEGHSDDLNVGLYLSHARTQFNNAVDAKRCGNLLEAYEFITDAGRCLQASSDALARLVSIERSDALLF